MDAVLDQENIATLPSGRILNLRRPRSDGPLGGEELAYCRAKGIGLAYDPAQIGWVAATCEDDIAPRTEAAEPRSRDRAPQRRADPAGRYRLRPWHENDVATFVALLDDPRVWRHMPESYPAPLTEETARDLIVLSNEAPHHEVLAAELEGEVVGQVRLAFDPVSGDRTEGEISYWLGERFWGRGIGGDLVSLFTASCFQRRPDLAAISARVHEANPASSRILEKCDYRYLGRASGDPAWKLYRRLRTDS